MTGATWNASRSHWARAVLSIIASLVKEGEKRESRKRPGGQKSDMNRSLTVYLASHFALAPTTNFKAALLSDLGVMSSNGTPLVLKSISRHVSPVEV
jgi:hypothetical protein